MIKEFATTKGLAEEANISESTIKFYSDQGLLIFYKAHNPTPTSEKRYPLNENLSIIKTIKNLKEKGYSIEMIKLYFGLENYSGIPRKENKLEKIIIENAKKYLPDLDLEFIKCIAMESYITCYWEGKEQPKDVLISLKFKSTEGNNEFTQFVGKEEKSGSVVWLVLYRICETLKLNIAHKKTLKLWDKKVREELNKYNQKVWDLIK